MRKQVTILIGSTLLSIGCDSFDPAGAYEGTATRSGETSRMVTDLQADGTLTADTNRFNNSEAGAVVTITRVDDTHLDLDMGSGCRVRVQQSPQPNEHNATVVSAPEQRCNAQLEGFSGELVMMGTVQLTKDDPPNIDVLLDGYAQQGNPDRAGFVSVHYTVTFNGQRRAQ